MQRGIFWAISVAIPLIPHFPGTDPTSGFPTQIRNSSVCSLTIVSFVATPLDDLTFPSRFPPCVTRRTKASLIRVCRGEDKGRAGGVQRSREERGDDVCAKLSLSLSLSRISRRRNKEVTVT